VSTYRTKQRRPAEVSVDQITEHELAGSAARLTAGLRSTETEVLDALPDNDIKAAMDSLPEGFRTVVYYADVQGYTYAETAAIMNIPIGTVMSRVSAAANGCASHWPTSPVVATISPLLHSALPERWSPQWN
jgi:DNA-directed RNA polymerase specialized sigma24 family protein